MDYVTHSMTDTDYDNLSTTEISNGRLSVTEMDLLPIWVTIDFQWKIRITTDTGYDRLYLQRQKKKYGRLAITETDYGWWMNCDRLLTMNLLLYNTYSTQII